METKVDFPKYIIENFSNELDKKFMEITDIFTKSMLKVRETYSFNIYSKGLALKEVEHDINDFISKYEIKKYKNNQRLFEYDVPFSLIGEWRELITQKRTATISDKSNSEALFTLTHSRFESIIEKLLDVYYKTFPNANTKKIENFTLENLKEFSSILEIGQYFHEQMVSQKIHEPKKKLFLWMKDKVGLDIDKKEYQLFELLYGMRNCIVHHDSIFDSRTAKLSKSWIKGNQFLVTSDIFYENWDCLFRLGHNMIISIWNNMGKSESIFYLSSKHYMNWTEYIDSSSMLNIVQYLLYSKMKRNVDDEIALKLHYCQMLKEIEENYLEILDEIEWTTKSEKYLIIKYGILDDIDRVFECMKGFKKNSTIEFSRQKIPLKLLLGFPYFNGVIDSPRFFNIYNEIFGKKAYKDFIINFQTGNDLSYLN